MKTAALKKRPSLLVAEAPPRLKRRFESAKVVRQRESLTVCRFESGGPKGSLRGQNRHPYGGRRGGNLTGATQQDCARRLIFIE